MRGPAIKEPLNKYRALSAFHGVCGKTRFAGNVGHLAKKRNAVHKPLFNNGGMRPSGGSGLRAECVVALDKV